jgi:hypothetical protein
MKSLRQSLAAFALLAFTSGAQALDPAQDPTVVPALLPAHVSLYTFADVYRLSAGGAPMPEYPPAAAAQPTQSIPVALASAASPAAPAAAQPQASYRFSIAAVPQPERWLLILSGLALAGWVARRRLGYSF